MSLGETAQLAVNLSLAGNFASGMASNEAALGRFHGSVGKAGGAMAGFGGAMDHAKGKIGGLIGSLGPLAGIAGIGGVVVGLKSAIDAAKSFDSQMELLNTQAGASQAEVESMKVALLKLAPAVGTTATDLAKGLYHIESAGLSGAKALDVLTAAAKGAKVGQADLESVTNALIASTNSGITGTTSMSQAMGVLNAIVGSGNMRMQDLTDAFGTGILSSAKAFGISIQSVGGALADMTNQGIPAIDAATRLRMTISLLGAPSTKAAKELATIGLGSMDLANAMRGPDGILGAVALLKDHLDKSGKSATEQAALISHAFGGGRSSSAILTLLGSLDQYRVIQDKVVKGTGAFGDAWEATKAQSDFAFESFGVAIDSLKIKIGTKLLPTVTEHLGQLTEWIGKNTDAIAAGIGNAVEFGSKAGAVIGDVIGKLATAWNTIPAPLRDVLVTGFIADKTIKFLFGFDPVAALGKGIVGAIGGTLFSRGSPTNPMFVVPLGGGGLGGAAGGLGGLAAGASLLTVAAAGAMTGLAVGLVYTVQQRISASTGEYAKGIHGTLDQSLATNPGNADLVTKLAAIDTGIREITSNPLNVLVQGSALEELRAMRSQVAAQLAGGGSGAGKRIDDRIISTDEQRESNRIARASATEMTNRIDYARIDTGARMDGTSAAVRDSQSAIVGAIERLAGAFNVSISVSDIANARDRQATTRPPTVLVRGGVVPHGAAI